MNRVITASLAALIVSVAGLAKADTVVPKFNLTGGWNSPDGSVAEYFQDGTALTWVVMSGGFAHTYSARYITPTKLEGIQHRVDRASGCSTEMLLTLTVVGANDVSVSAKALDSNCDLVKGQIYTSSAYRVL